MNTLTFTHTDIAEHAPMFVGMYVYMIKTYSFVFCNTPIKVQLENFATLS